MFQSFTHTLSKVVSGDRRRWIDKKHNLDLTYITNNILAMGI
jgi:hypothetical protein